jgi:ribosome biogenesis protein NSA1
LPQNPQTLLQQPIWATAIEFLSKTDTAPINGSNELLAIGTAYEQLQIYDIRSNATQRRPVLYTPEWDSNKENILEHRVTSLCQIDSNRIVVGDAAGYIHTLDLRKITNKHGRSVRASTGRFNGPAGSIRQIVKHETLPIIACVGLDRMMRTFDINKRKQLDCVYLKQRLNALLFCADGTWSNNSSADDDDDEDEEGSGNESETEDEGDVEDEDVVEDYVDSSGDEAGDASEDEEMEGAAPKSKRRRK